MSAAKDPLIEKSAQVSSGRVLDRTNEIDRLDVALRVALDVVPDRSPEPRVAEFAAQHVQHGRALLIEVTVENFDRIAIAIVDDRPPVAIRVFFQVGRDALEDVVEVLVVAQIRFAPNRFEERGEAFVEPRVRPVAAGQQIAEPLVRQLVRNQRIARKIEMGARIVQGAVGLRRRRRILHAAENEIADGDLRVARVRIRRAGAFLERLDHSRRVLPKARSPSASRPGRT